MREAKITKIKIRRLTPVGLRNPPTRHCVRRKKDFLLLFHNPVSPITSRLQTKGSYTGNCFRSKRRSSGKDEESYQLDLKMDSSVSLAESAA